MAIPPSADLNKFIAIGTVTDEPRVKYVPQRESYLVEFMLRGMIDDPVQADSQLIPADYLVIARKEKLALYLKDVLQQGMRLFIEGNLIPGPAAQKNKDGIAAAGFHIDLREVELIDRPDKPAYPEGIKRIDK